MISYLRPACLALALVGTAGSACAQTWVYEPDYGARAYRPAVVYQERYLPRAYNAYAYEPVVAAPPVALAATQRTVVNRTIIPQGRGRGPIVRERIVTETTAPVLRPPLLGRPAVAVTEAYALAPAPRVVRRPVVTEAYALAPAPRVVTRPVVTEAYAYAPLARPVVTVPVVTTVPVVQTYRYVNPLAVDPITGVFLSDQ
jgi:hypothetical protein